MTETLQMPLGLNMAPAMTSPMAPPSLPARPQPAAAPAPAAPGAAPMVPLPISMQPRVGSRVTDAAPSSRPGHAPATLSESGLRTSEDFAPSKGGPWMRQEAEAAPEESHGISAVGALSVSIIGLFAWPLISGVLAVCMGVWALSEMKFTGNDAGRRSAVFGVFIGLLNLGFWVVYAMSSVSQDLGK
jgi:hypothetical protein